MLDKYKGGQPIVCQILNNQFVTKNISHAYLFQINDYLYADKLITDFVKMLICPNSNIDKKCDNCFICKRIDNNSFSELMIIEPSGDVIKKEQLLKLQKEYSYKPIEGKKRVYVIKEIDKLNIHAANSVLKFLEEPEEGVIAILLTNNINKVLNTIVSRCQVISFNKSKMDDYLTYYKEYSNQTLVKVSIIFCPSNMNLDEYIKEYQVEKKINALINFILQYEREGIDILLHVKKQWHDYFHDRVDVSFAMDLMIYFYQDVIKYKNLKKVDIFSDYINDIEYVASKNNINELGKKIKIIIDLREKIKYNINLNLLIEKLMLNMEGAVDYD